MVTSASFGWFIIAREMAYDRSQLEAHGTLLTKSVAHLIQNTIDLSDRAALQLLTERIIEDEDVTQCTLLNDEGKTLAHASKIMPDLHSRYLLNHPLSSREGQKMGTLHLTLSFAKNGRKDGRIEKRPSSGGLWGGGRWNLVHSDLYPAPHSSHRKAGLRNEEGCQRRIGLQGPYPVRDEIGDLAEALTR